MLTEGIEYLKKNIDDLKNMHEKNIKKRQHFS